MTDLLAGPAARLFADPLLWSLCLLVVTVGATVQTVSGQAFGMLVAPFLTLLAPDAVPAAVLLLGVAVTAMAAGRDWSAIRWGELVPALAGRAAGAALASVLLAFLVAGGSGRALIAVAIGLSTLLAVALSLSGWRLAITLRTLLGAGALSGFMATFTSIGAPPMALLYQSRRGPELRATLNLFFLIGMGFSLAALLPHGLLTRADAVVAVALAPGLFAGALLGRALAARLDGVSLRPAILTLASLAALGILARAAFA